MSFIETKDHTWAADTWPPYLQFGAALGIPAYSAHTPEWMVAPNTMANMFDWAYVAKNQRTLDASREQMLLYKNPPRVATNTLFPVAIRLQGFIARCNLGPLGNWNGEPLHAVSSTQSVVLECQGMLEPWDATLATLQAIEDLVQNSLHSFGNTETFTDRSARSGEQELYCSRRVFEKARITPHNRSFRLSVLEEGDDPLGKCDAIDRDWRVTRKLPSGRLTKDQDDGDCFEAYNARAFQAGDFVDVCIGFDIVSMRQHRRSDPRFKIRPTIQHIILLRKVSEQDEETNLDDTESIGNHVFVTVEEQGLSF
ncbi:hypothetical protein C8R43DRAFT_1137398 [Mycena crocata]|nr:hypothetical protein C8R43DRAFT_1137398 [Mycena crocata]